MIKTIFFIPGPKGPHNDFCGSSRLDACMCNHGRGIASPSSSKTIDLRTEPLNRFSPTMIVPDTYHGWDTLASSQCALGCGHRQGVVGGSTLRNVGDNFALRPPYLVVEVVVPMPTEGVLQILSEWEQYLIPSSIHKSYMSPF